MANLTRGNIIIGHTTDHATLIWVRSERRRRWAKVALENAGNGSPVHTIVCRLRACQDFTGCAPFSGLSADTLYNVSARFACTRRGLKRDHSAPGARGQVRTFPASNSKEPFCFLHGSCNLSTVRLAHAGGLLAGTVGALLAMLSLEGGGWGFKVRQWLQRCLYKSVLKATRFEQSKLALSSPFDRLPKPVTRSGGNEPRFMIHAGDQIYFDFPFNGREPDPEEYRRTYRQTWFEDPASRQFLAQCPHYMMLDDHDIVDGFANDRTLPGDTSRKHADYLQAAKQAYGEYVHLRHPSRKSDGSFYYQFEYGSTPFFVMDTRTERFFRKEQMIDDEQLTALVDWLKCYKTRLKFVVSSVAFLAELRPDRERGLVSARDDAKMAPADEERIDKWCGRPYRRQRESILRCVLENKIERLVFLVGDMHCAYHATMQVGYVGHGLTLHELAGGPLYQLRFASRRDFYDQCRGTIRSGSHVFPYATSLRRIQGASSSVLQISAAPAEVCWKIVPTTGSVASRPGPEKSRQSGEWHGRIRF